MELFKLFTPFYISNADLTTQKNKKKCKINSRNFTYDGLTFSSSYNIIIDNNIIISKKNIFYFILIIKEYLIIIII